MVAPVPLPVRFKLPPAPPPRDDEDAPRPPPPLSPPSSIPRRSYAALFPESFARICAKPATPPPSMAPLTDDALPRRKRSARLFRK
jgi:hypothetical protein